MWDVDMTLRECIREVAARLAATDSCYGHGTQSPQDEAAWLVMHASGLSHPDLEIDSGMLKKLEELLDRRIRLKVPAAYLVGYTWFCGLKFEVNRDVLIPRSPVAELIPGGFQPWLNPDQPISALDLCTGSGCIAVAMAHYWPDWQIDAVDISAQALALANTNCEIHGVKDRVQIFAGDLFAPCGDKRYELIVANPPYVASAEYAILPAEYQAEPALGLIAGDDGLDVVYRILDQAASHLSEQGILVCEVGNTDATLIAQMPDAAFMWFEFEHGGQGVFMLDRAQLVDLAEAIQQNMSERTDVQ